VWSFDVAQAFAVRCRTIVTSRNATVANGILTPQTYSVSVSEGTNLNGNDEFEYYSHHYMMMAL
jgi:hypothetical protein